MSPRVAIFIMTLLKHVYRRSITRRTACVRKRHFHQCLSPPVQTSTTSTSRHTNTVISDHKAVPPQWHKLPGRVHPSYSGGQPQVFFLSQSQTQDQLACQGQYKNVSVCFHSHAWALSVKAISNARQGVPWPAEHNDITMMTMTSTVPSTESVGGTDRRGTRG